MSENQTLDRKLRVSQEQMWQWLSEYDDVPDCALGSKDQKIVDLIHDRMLMLVSAGVTIHVLDELREEGKFLIDEDEYYRRLRERIDKALEGESG